MTLQLEENEAMEIFHTALCNGLSYLRGYEIRVIYASSEYETARAKLNEPCYEDVLVQLLKDGGTLIAVDDEGEEDYPIVESDVLERMVEVPMENLQNIINETDDAIDSDCVLQTIFFKDIMFG